MASLSLQGPAAVQDLSVGRVKEWTYDKAVDKVVQLLGVSATNAEHEVALSVGQDINNPIPQDRLDHALRRLQADPANTIHPAQFTHAMIRFYLELSHVDPSTLPNSFTGTAQKFLDALSRDHIITPKQSRGALIFYITERCNEESHTLLLTSRGQVLEAVRLGRKTNQLTPEEAQIALFCLLTGLGPIEARGEGAATDVHGAVRKACSDKTLKLQPVNIAAKCIQALLFPLGHELEDVIAQELFDIAFGAPDSDDMDWDYSKAREKYMIRFLKKEVQPVPVTDKEAKACLAECDWYMSPAVLKISSVSKVMQPPPLSHIQTYDTAGPPDVQNNCMIVGLLGVVDRGAPFHTASPAADGWMASDHYLMKHLLRDLGHSQTWMTCVPPSQLVEKYTQSDARGDITVRIGNKCVEEDDQQEKNKQWSGNTGYTHEEASTERVIVLDADSLKFAEQDLRVVEEKSLLPEYLKVVEHTFEQAQANERPVLLLMYSHGDVETFNNLGGLLIGFQDLYNVRKEDFLTATHIADIHAKYPKVKLTLFMTSCYSGNWVTTPHFVSQDPDITVIAATRPGEMSRSFAYSTPMCHAGGVLSHAFKDASDDGNSEEKLAKEYGELMEDVVAGVRGLLVNKNDVAMGQASLPMFSPDTTQEKFYKRTGYPLSTYQANYDRLKKLPVSAWDDGRVSRTAGSSQRSSYGRWTHHFPGSVRHLIWEYEKSFPTNTPKDHQLIQLINMAKANALHDNAAYCALHDQLTFRASKCTFANEIVRKLELYKGAVTPIWEWNPHQNVGDAFRTRMLDVVILIKHNCSWGMPPRGQKMGWAMRSRGGMWLTQCACITSPTKKCWP